MIADDCGFHCGVGFVVSLVAAVTQSVGDGLRRASRAQHFRIGWGVLRYKCYRLNVAASLCRCYACSGPHY
jgi:hypothetical protein